jgi:hypothetical protein
VNEPRLEVGDVVELIADVPGRKGLRAGRRGVVVVAGDAAPWGMVTISFGVAGRQSWLLHAKHLRLVERAPRPVAEDADAD